MKKILLAATVIVCFLLTNAWVCLASGPLKVTFNQGADCTLVDHWDVFAAPGVVLAGDASGVKVGTIVNTVAAGVCGSNETAIEAFTGAGTRTVWLAAVDVVDAVTVFSNPITATVPLAAPALVSVVK